MTFRGSEFGGPRYGWGSVRGTPEPGGGRAQYQDGRVRGPSGASPEAGLHRGEWQWRGHGPGAASNYGWEYQGGVARDTPLMHTEAGMGPRGYYEQRLAEERSGGLPRGRARFDADRQWDRMAGGRSRGSGVRGGYDRQYDATGSSYAGGYGRSHPLENDPRWRGDAERIRGELARFDDPRRGFGQGTAWNRYWNEGHGSGRDADRGYDDGFRPRSYF